MRRRRCAGGLVLAVALLGGVASAEDWSAQAGRTLGNGAGLFWAQFGWPGISADLAYGVGERLDLGGRFSFNYGQEGLTDSGTLGLKFQFTVRAQLLFRKKFDLALRFDPGLLLYFPNSTTVVGMTFPVGLEAGFPLSPLLRVTGTFELPFWVTFNGPARFYAPILFGGGVEYLLQRDLAVTARLKMGPTIASSSVPRSAYFTLYFLLGFAYRF